MATNGTSKHLVAGGGEIGSAIAAVLQAHIVDKDPQKNTWSEWQYDYLHICFPYFNGFEKEVAEYQKEFEPKLTIIHSTVPIGTSLKCGAVHSPCRGKHPNLYAGIKTFTKYFGGKKSKEAAELFSSKGVPVESGFTSNDTEAMKLWDTTMYGWNILLEKEVYKYCKDNGLNFDLIYTKANESYNKGYEQLGYPEFKKYILNHVEGKVGGHCVINNLPLLGGFISDTLKKYNDSL
jgi:hypothetical protein